ncbi:MAG: 3-isopropylmalate dehydratase large subunit [Ancalomicrobiaceae bacterium]|nr:3-isopropylmalate dehydratase large subunit [Ancalomicrobiaceae bacterium]
MTGPNGLPATIFDKIWMNHLIESREDGQDLIYIDRHYIHDVTAPAFELLRQRSLAPRSPHLIFGTPDHYVPTHSREMTAINHPERRAMIDALMSDAASAGITVFPLGDRRQGIVHVVGPEQGLSLPGATIVCADSHTSTHGALGALAFGIGATEVGHVLATQSLWQKKPLNMRIRVEGQLPEGITAKDLILAVIAQIGVAGARGHAVEYAGPGIEALSMESRLTLCNMTIEAGGRVGFIAPDDTTFDYLAGRPYAPKGAEWDAAVAAWRELRSDPDAVFDREVTIDANVLAPMVTWGTTPEDALPITGVVPDPSTLADPEQRAAMAKSLAYMGLEPGTRLDGIAVDRVFIGSCTNGRIEDLRLAAHIVAGRQVASGVSAWVVPGSGLVKAQAEAEGLDRIFLKAGFEWRHPGCSMCLATNGDAVAPGERCASTSNRNFVGRQGPGARTHLMNPAMAAAAAVTGRLTDVRRLVEGH